MSHRHIHTSSRLYTKSSGDTHSLLPACVPHSRLPENWHMGNKMCIRDSVYVVLPPAAARSGKIVRIDSHVLMSSWLLLMIHSVFLCPLNDTILQFGIIQDFFLLRNDKVQLVSSYSKNPLFSRISGVSTPNNVSSGCVYFLLFVTKIVIIKSHAQ